jgi:hypothetical protein
MNLMARRHREGGPGDRVFGHISSINSAARAVEFPERPRGAEVYPELADNPNAVYSSLRQLICVISGALRAMSAAKFKAQMIQDGERYRTEDRHAPLHGSITCGKAPVASVVI